MPSNKEIKTSIHRANIYIDELDSLLEERERLVQILKLSPSKNDNYDLINLLERLNKHLSYLYDDINNLKGENTEFEQEFNDLIRKYDAAIRKLEDDSLDIEEYVYHAKEFVKEEVKRDLKSVRFKDNLEEEQEEQDRHTLMGSRPYEPYLDNPDSTDAESFDALSNQQIYAQHQQQLLQQDENLDALHQLIRNQHQIGITINSELDDHMIILNDLEQGVDNSTFRLNNARSKLADFRRRCQENGSLVTIVVLTVILILLLVVLN